MDWTSVKLSFEPPRASMIKYVIVFLGNRSQDPLKVRCELYAKSKVFYRCYFAFFLDDRLYMYNQKCSRKSCTMLLVVRVSQGFWGTREHWQNIEGNKGTLANFWEQRNKIRKITVRKHSERVWEHGNIGQFWKGTREQGPPLGDPQ